jgi:soluble P-type ATPase
MSEPRPIVVAIPGRRPLVMSHLLLDFNGTLAQDGNLLPGVTSRLRQLGQQFRIVVATADTFGKARSALRGLPVDVEIVETGRDKLRLLRRLGPSHTVALGNGRNDVPILQKAALGLVVIGPEGAARDAVRTADILVRDIREGLDLLLKPLRLKATYRR